MSRRANPITIGIFVSAALGLFSGLLIFLGSAKLFNETETFILFFDESVNGLNVGSAVKFKGVPIGKVSRILIRAEGQPLQSSAIPVIIELDETRLEQELNVGIDISNEEDFAFMIQDGLRGKLNTESLITGLLFVELDYQLNPAPPLFVQEEYVYKEIPTVPSTVQAITQTFMEAVGKLSQVDFLALLQTVQETIEITRDRVAGLDTVRLSASIATTAETLNAKLEAFDLQPTLDQINQTLADISGLTGTLEGETNEVTDELRKTLGSLQELAATFNRAGANLEGILAEDSKFRYNTNQLMHELTLTSQSIRLLVEYVERNPRSFLTGRASGGSGEKVQP